MTAAPQTGLPPDIAGADWFQRPELRAVFNALNRDGHEARIVGGALRNTLMGRPIGDIDFAVSAKPEKIIDLANAAGLKTVPTGLSHGTVTIVVNGVPFEATALRHDVETDGRYAKVAFTKDWAADAARRDFTINALYADAAGHVHDPLGEGISDIEAGRVRFIGRAVDRIREDYLRILRFFRFTADYSAGPPDPAGLSACIGEQAGLAKLSAERIRAEMLRILVARRPAFALEPMADSGILLAILGGVAYMVSFVRLTGIEKALTMPPDPIRGLAALGVAVKEDAARLAEKLRLSNAEAARLEMTAESPAISPQIGEAARRALLYRSGGDVFTDRVLIEWSRSGDTDDDPGWRGLVSLPNRWTVPVFPLHGKDLLSQGFLPGPAVGETLRKLEDRWIASDFSMSREDLLAMLAT